MASSDLTRRRFLARLGQLGAATSPLWAASRAVCAQSQAPAAPTNVRIVSGNSGTGRRLLLPSDFNLLGSFSLPGGVPGAISPDWGKGLAFRRVNNERRLILASWQNGAPEVIYEVRVPASPSGTAALVQTWGDIFGGKKVLQNDGGVPELFGLYWDELDQRLYWSYRSGYTDYSGDQWCLGYSTLGATASAFGPWAISGTGKRANNGILGIPRDFADAYCQGRRLGAGFGGYQSVASSGLASMGPALHAFDPPNSPPQGSIPQTTLVSYPFAAQPGAGVGRCQRDSNFQQSFDAWPNNVFTWTDEIFQGGVWIQTDAVEGVAFIARISHGRCWYENSDRHSESTDQEVFIYNRDDLARVATGLQPAYGVQPTNRGVLPLPTNSTPNGESPWSIAVGVAWDAVEKRVYVWMRGTSVYIFQIG